MRLTCPNCGAQYEVPEDVIPLAGRDVQCSNCGHTWFQSRGNGTETDELSGPGLPQSSEEAARRPAPPPPEPEFVEPEPEEDRHNAEQTHAEAGSSQDYGHEAQGEENVAAAVAAMMGVPAPAPASSSSDSDQPLRRRSLDPSVAEILREEAEREVARRGSEAPSFESQPDLGLDDSHDIEARREDEARRRLARLKGEPVIAAPAPRRERLPDIEEINSSLRSTTERPDAGHVHDDGRETRPRRGFRTGFMLALLVALAGYGVYAFAPRIAASYPDAEPYLARYVDMVNEGRLWLDAQVRAVIASAQSGDGT